MEKAWLGVLVLAVILFGFIYINQKNPGFAPKQTVAEDSNSGYNLNQISSIIINNTNVTSNRTTIKIPYFCSYHSLAGGGGGCAPWLPCSCLESGDRGDEPCVFGIVNMTVNQTVNVYNDYCSDNMTLNEFYCGGNSSIRNTIYRCPNGCFNGVCI